MMIPQHELKVEVGGRSRRYFKEVFDAAGCPPAGSRTGWWCGEKVAAECDVSSGPL